MGTLASYQKQEYILASLVLYSVVVCILYVLWIIRAVVCILCIEYYSRMHLRRQGRQCTSAGWYISGFEIPGNGPRTEETTSQSITTPTSSQHYGCMTTMNSQYGSYFDIIFWYFQLHMIRYISNISIFPRKRKNPKQVLVLEIGQASHRSGVCITLRSSFINY